MVERIKKTKRIIDLTLVVLSGFIVIPLSLLLSIMIQLDSPGKILYKHERIGKNGRMFTLWKFRTMFINADEILEGYLEQNPHAQIEWQQTQKIKSDPRITRMGKLLRRTSLDELPQLWNILKGEMSLVGPRPIVQSELVHYGGLANPCFSVRPGLTGLWQVSGRNNTTYEERVQFDEYYVNNWSIRLDIYILLRTILVVLRADGAY
jgi:Undecaprenyl-phosphate galactose phosphotransferase WbaP